jgi:hypothetical protein
MADIKAQTDKYYQAQLHRFDNIQTLLDKGVPVLCVAQYDYPLIDVGETWDSQNADFIIQLDSTSLGAHAANVGETLPEDYVQQNTYCDDPTHNHISPDRVVDASTGLLPDTTFYFDGQAHEKTARNDAIIALATRLLAYDDIKNVYSTPDFPQFNGARDPRGLKNTWIPTAKAVDASTLSEADAAELAAAIEEAEAFVNSTACYAGEQKEVEDRIISILTKIGAYTPKEPEEESTFFKDASLWLFNTFGTNGFSEIPVESVKLLFKTIGSLFGDLF